jgi:DNA-directed RNA polymerase specialized sigma24 family protein
MTLTTQAAPQRAAVTPRRADSAPAPLEDPRAFAEQRARLLRSVGRDTGAPPSVVEDGVSHAFEQMCRHPTRPETLTSWLRVVARHEVWRLMGRLRREPLADGTALGEEVPDPHSVELAIEARQALGILAALGANRRETLTLGAAGHSYAEIQRIRGVTYTNVNRHMSEGRAMARALRAASPEQVAT